MNRRATIGWGILLLGVGTLLCFIPLLNLLAFEFAFILSLPISFMAAHMGTQMPQDHGVWVAWVRGIPRAFLLALLPVIPITLNMVRVRNCDYLEGVVVYLALPGLTVVVATGWGAALARFRRPMWAFTGIFVGALLLALYRFFTQPPIDIFSPFMGFYPGSIYDEIIHLGGRLLWSRAEDIGWAALVVALLAAPSRQKWPVTGGVALVLGGLFFGAAQNGIHRDASYVQRALGGHLSTAHLQLYYPKKWPAERAELLGIEFEFSYARLKAWIGAAPDVPIAVYLYPDRATKKRLIGAGRTRIAKPWQRAVHIHRPVIGQSVLTHELAHAFSAEISNGPHHLSLSGMLPNMGMIEGFAVAATWQSEPLDKHQWSAAMRQIKVAPDLKRLLQPTGFLSKHSRTAYTICGSFVRFLHQERGAEAVAKAYRTGHIDDFDVLHQAWTTHLDALPISERALSHARAAYDQPSIFSKVCAHEVAALRRSVSEHRGKPAQALVLVDELLGHIPGNVSTRLIRLNLLFLLGRLDEARQIAKSLRDDPKSGANARARAIEWIADLDAQAGAVDLARAGYLKVQASAFRRAQRRRLAVKLAALDHPARHEVLAYLLTRGDDAKAQLEAMQNAAPNWPIADYLASRWKESPQAQTDQLAILATQLTAPSLVYETLRMRAATLFEAARYSEAATAFEALAERPDLDIQTGEHAGLLLWRDRARFFEQHHPDHHRVDSTASPPEDAPK